MCSEFLFLFYFLLWFAHLKNNNHSSLSSRLYRPASYREKPLPISSASDSEDLTNIFWGCVFSGFVCITSQIERFAGLFLEACRLLFLLMSVGSAAGSVGLRQDTELSFVLSDTQASKICQFLIITPSKMRQKLVLWALYQKAEMLSAHSSLLFLSQWRSHEVFAPDCTQLCWLWGRAILFLYEMVFLACFNVAILYFKLAWGYNNFLTHFWDLKRLFELYIVKLVSLSGNKIRSFLFCHLAQILNKASLFSTIFSLEKIEQSRVEMCMGRVKVCVCTRIVGRRKDINIWAPTMAHSG